MREAACGLVGEVAGDDFVGGEVGDYEWDFCADDGGGEW